MKFWWWIVENGTDREQQTQITNVKIFFSRCIIITLKNKAMKHKGEIFCLFFFLFLN